MSSALDYWLDRPTTEPTDRYGLPAGEWVRVGAVLRFRPSPIPHKPTPKPKRRSTPAEQPRHSKWHPIISPLRFAGRPCCNVCRCLLTHADETCPGCLAWAERDAVRTSWRRPMEMAA